jgi:hypothetical protein
MANSRSPGTSGEERVMAHKVTDLIHAVESTHKGLGRLAGMTLVASKARQCMITVSPPGCGKSTVGAWLETVHPEAYTKQSVTRSSLKTYETLFNDFQGCVIFDDLGAVDTEWSRNQTLVTMAELVYGHFINKDSHQLHIDIENFQGSAILNIQPNVLKEVVEHPSWNSNLADKSLRYYHLKRAVTPNAGPIEAKVEWGGDIDQIEAYEGESKLWQTILSIGQEQWTRPRAMEHCAALLKAVTALGGKGYSDEEDIQILLDLMRPMTVEMEMIERQGFGSKATLNDNLLYMMVEFATYNPVTYEDIGRDYHMKPHKVQIVLSHMIDWFHKTGTNPVKLQPTQQMTELLKKAGAR